MRSKPVKYGLLLANQGGSWKEHVLVKIEEWRGGQGPNHRKYFPWVRVLESGSTGFLYEYMPWKPVLNICDDAAIMSSMLESIEGLPPGTGRVRWYRGAQGVGIYTVDEDSAGYYTVFYAKPSGKGARKGKAKKFLVVDYKTTQRRTKTKAIDRAFELAFGYSRREPKVKRAAKAQLPGQGYCMRQK